MKENQNNRKWFCCPVKPCLTVLLITASISFSACSQKNVSSTADYIGIDGAKEAALKAADVSSDQAEFISAGLDNKNGTFYYQVIFREDNMEHTYDIDALTGIVIEENHSQQAADTQASTAESGEAQPSAAESREAQPSAAKSGKAQASTAESGEAQPSAAESSQAGRERKNNGNQQTLKSSSSAGGAQGIDSDTALSMALTHAGLTETDITFSKVKSDIEDGRSVFEVELVTSDGTEYDYELSAEDGTIFSYDFDAESLFRQLPTADMGIVSESQAMQTVLDCVPGAAAQDVTIYLKEDDGRMEYEGKFIYDNMKYEFKIDAYSGGLMEWEAERIGK